MADDTPKRRPGRPTLKAGEPSVPCYLRLPSSEYNLAVRLAEKNRVSVPHLLRTAFRLAVKRDTLGE